MVLPNTWDLLSIWVLTETNHAATKPWLVNDHPNPLDSTYVYFYVIINLLLLFLLALFNGILND